MKYIVVRGSDGEAPVLFPVAYYHSFVAGRLAPAEVVGAGFVRMTDAGPECYGGSSSLGIRSRGDRDTAIVRGALGGVVVMPDNNPC